MYCQSLSIFFVFYYQMKTGIIIAMEICDGDLDRLLYKRSDKMSSCIICMHLWIHVYMIVTGSGKRYKFTKHKVLQFKQKCEFRSNYGIFKNHNLYPFFHIWAKCECEIQLTSGFYVKIQQLNQNRK